MTRGYVLCKHGHTEKGFVTVTLEKKETIVLVKNTPAEICTNCGYYYLSESTTAEVLDKGNEALSKGAELQIIKLKVA